MAGATNLLWKLWAFLRPRKEWWLLPVVVILVVVGALLAFGQKSAPAPFTYTLS